MKNLLLLVLIPLCYLITFPLTGLAQETTRAYQAPQFAPGWSRPGLHPDHIILNFSGNPATSASVTWRTSPDVKKGVAEIALATAAPKFWRNALTIPATTQTMDASDVETAEVVSNYHSVTFQNLLPDTLYAYRVGDGNIWSEWIQFRTASLEPRPFSFLYVGDAQNYIMELWSRLIREGYRKAPDASLIIHAGDLVNRAHNEQEWHEWFTAGGWIHRMVPSIPTPGNHEFRAYNEEDKKNKTRRLSVQWQPQFTLPQNGPEELKETVYYIDYQGVRFISLNSSQMQAEQAAWLEQVLANNPNKWTVATYHHPLFSASSGRDNQKLRELWKPLFDKYQVDIALQGHDHTYARGRVSPTSNNVVDGMNTRDETGTVYVVSVSGGKMYELKPDAWNRYEAERDRAAENTQLFQVIHVDNDTLAYEAYTATGTLYDAFNLIKSANGEPNRFVDKQPQDVTERSHDNTISYQDVLPETIKADLMNRYPGYKFDRINFGQRDGVSGYRVKLEKGKSEVILTITTEGKVLSEQVNE